MPDVAEALAAAGSRTIQLRLKGVDDRTRLDVQRRAMASLATGPPVTLVINDRPDLAAVLAHEAPTGVRAGLHLGQDDLDPALARELLGPDVLIGLSTHTIAQVQRAAEAPVDYLGFGPVFTTRSRVDPDPTTGLDALREASAISPLPLVAIGGLDAERIPAVRRFGAAAVAIIAALFGGLALDSASGLERLRIRARSLHDAADDGYR
jgi:thiamine-phosphate pyrophosphorylase